MKKKEPKVNPILTRVGQTIDLVKFNIKPEKEQYSEIEKLLKDIYLDDLKVTRKHILKCIRLTINPKDDYIYLPYNLKISKKKLTLQFVVEPKKPLGFSWFIFAIWLFIFTLIGATYAGFVYLSIADLNKDIDGDGIADINLDINNDRKAEINIDINKDDKPDLNIDYKGDRKARFNIDNNNDGIADFNFVNDATGGKKCTINCDIDGDGWPDLNLDLDGDGTVDTDIDMDNDGVADLNLDINGDGICDLMCDTDGDFICDFKCIKPGYIDDPELTGSSSQHGKPDIDTNTPYLIINYVDGVSVNVEDLLPDDQPEIEGFVNKVPYKEFTIENLSDYPLFYNLRWNVVKNTFITNNLKYKVIGSNGGVNFETQTVPKASDNIALRIVIPPRVVQKYRIEFNLKGIGREQNEDQGKVFVGNIEVNV